MAPANSWARNEDHIEIERKLVPERYMDIITYEFAYDPVKLPLDQDPTQSLYNRKTLETIWENKPNGQAENPITKRWFNAKTVIPQVELRQEMEDYIELQKFSKCKPAEIDVIEEYTKVLEEGDMNQYLDVLKKTLSENLTTNIQCSALWKKINLLRMYCQFHWKNIETFRSLHGFRCLNELIIQIRMLLINNSIEENIKEAVWDVCKEITRAIDVIGLKPLDIYDIEKPREVLVIEGYVKMIVGYSDLVYLYNESNVKIYSLMLKMFCKIFDEMSAQIEKTLGKELYLTYVAGMGSVIVTRTLCQTNAWDISSEDLKHAISILRRSRCFSNPVNSEMFVNALIICIVRENNKSEEMKDVGDGQLLEAEAEGRHNCEALELGLSLVEDIFMTEGPSAAHILGESWHIAEEMIRMFKHSTGQDENEDETLELHNLDWISAQLYGELEELYGELEDFS